MVQTPIGLSVPRTDAPDKVRGTAKYTQDLAPKDALIALVLHSTIANGLVTAMDTYDAEQVPGVVRIFTCLEVPQILYPTAGHPWSVDPDHQDIADRIVLNKRVRYLGDDIAAVVAEDEVAARRALALIKVTYDEYPVAVTPEQALAAEAMHPHLFPTNMLKEHSYAQGDLDSLRGREDLIHIKKTYSTSPVQHCHLEGAESFAYGEGGKIVVVSSTQIPHILRRVIGQALNRPWGEIRVIKPYIGGGFGNKQDVLYEPLNAYLCQELGGRCVKMKISRDEIFTSTRQRHAIRFNVEAWADREGNLLGRDIDIMAQNGGYAAHGHAITANAATYMRDIYQDKQGLAVAAHTVYTNTGCAGAMRGYGIPQGCFALECMMEDIALKLNIDPIAIREKNMMQAGFVDPGTGIACNSYGLAECIAKGKELFNWDFKRAEYAFQDGPVRRGVGMSIFTYKTGVYPISLETATARMMLNQDGSIQLHLGATEIGQGGDTVFCQMAAAAVGVDFEDIHIVSSQDTDTAPFDTGAYASRQTYVTGKAIRLTGETLKQGIIDYAAQLLGLPAVGLELRDHQIIKRTIEQPVISLPDLAMRAFYELGGTKYISAECTSHCTDNTFAFGCCFAEVEVDMPLGQVKVLDILNVHDSGTLINPKLAEAQVHGGMSMGLGYALSEAMWYDDKGKLLNGNLLDYKLPTAMDTPNLRCAFVQTEDPTGPFGNKALGEPPAIPVAPALRNAILQATGVAVDQLPMDQRLLVSLFQERGLI